MYASTGYRGLGSQQSAQQTVQFASAGASAAVSGAVAAGLISTTAIPFIGPAIAAAALIAEILIQNSGCGQTCIQTSAWANQAAQALQQNSDAYFALPVPRSRSNQQLALQTFDQIWGKLVQMCSDPQWGNAGKRCVSDRQAGACTWHQTKTGGHPGEPGLGECWNWFNGYRDPIANDPNVIDDELSTVSTAANDVSSAVDSFFAGGTSSLLPWLAVGGLVALAVAA
jgi:hypothetical protein